MSLTDSINRWAARRAGLARVISVCEVPFGSSYFTQSIPYTDMSKSVRVLHVEDDSEVADLTKAHLGRGNERFEIVHTSTASAGLEHVANETIDCIVSNYELPQQTGLDFLRTVRETEPYVPFIIFTEAGSEAVASEAISAGVTEYVQRSGPESYEVLADRIENAVTQSHSRQLREVVKQEPLELIDRFSDPLYTLNGEWEFTYLNEPAADIFGKSVESLLGTVIWQEFPEIKQSPFYDHYHEALAEGEPRTIEEQLGAWRRWYREHIYPSEDGLTIISHDITEQKRREKQLQELSQFQDAVIQNSDVWINVLNEDGDVVVWNKAAEQISGYTSEEVVGDDQVWEWLYPDPEYRQQIAEFADDILRGEASADGYETVITTKDGDERVISWHSHQITHESGNVSGSVAIGRDVTDSKELASERKLVRRIFENSPVAKIVYNTEGEIVRLNERAKTLLGVTESDTLRQAYDAGDWRFIDTDGDPVSSDELPFARVLATDASIREFVLGVDRPGERRLWLSINATPIHDDRGEVEYVISSLTNITEQVAQEEELERQLDLFEKAQQMANIGAWEYDIQTESGYWTSEAARIHGLSPSVEPTPELVVQSVHPEDKDAVRTAFDRVDEPYDIEFRLVDEDGTQRWVRAQGEPTYEDGDVTKVRGAIQEITERKEREITLERMTRAVDEAPIGITLSDPSQEDNPLIYVNDHFVELTGYTRDEILGRNCRFLQGEQTDPRTIAELRRAIDRAEPISTEIRNYRADGAEYWNYLKIAPIRDADGAVLNYIGFQQDVTERVERQRQLDKLGRYLRHNIRNNMNVISGFADLIQSDGEPPLTTYAERIEQTASKLMENTETQREIAKILREEPASKSVEVVSLLETIVTELREQYPNSELTVTGPDAITVRATDEVTLALTELIENALEHTDNSSPTVSVDISATDGSVAITITDNGPGIPEMEKRILMGAAVEQPTYHSQGLGLWLIHTQGHKYVKTFGGSMSSSAVSAAA